MDKRMIEAALDKAAVAIRTLDDGSVDDAFARATLLSVIKEIAPERKKILSKAVHGTRVKLTDASIDELYAAVQSDCDLALKLLGTDASVPPYRQVERLFRAVESTRGVGSIGLVHNIEEAVQLTSALDFGTNAAWRMEAREEADNGSSLLPNGIIEILSSASTRSTPLESEARSVHGATTSAVGSTEEEEVSLAYSSSVLECGVYGLVSHPGFYIAPGCLNAALQADVTRNILYRYIERPNRRNIDAEVDTDLSNVAWAEQNGQLHSSLLGDAALPGNSFRSHLWEEYCTWLEKESACDSPQPALLRLSWATLGLQYDWTARAYHCKGDEDYDRHQRDAARQETDGRGGSEASRDNRWVATFPPSLHDLASIIVSQFNLAVQSAVDQGRLPNMAGPISSGDAHPLGLPLHLDGQAGIVNLYSASSKLPMGGHRDDMERTFLPPVLSLSLGCTAVFLLGGATKDVRPTPVILRSGDVVLLSGGCRLAYHGVARVFAGTAPHLFSVPKEPTGVPPDVHAMDVYLSTHRLNINVRQVLETDVHATL